MTIVANSRKENISASNVVASQIHRIRVHDFSKYAAADRGHLYIAIVAYSVTRTRTHSFETLNMRSTRLGSAQDGGNFATRIFPLTSVHVRFSLFMIHQRRRQTRPIIDVPHS